jgi:hypothetical protein
MTQGPSFAGGHESPCPFIQEPPEGGEFLLELSERFHAPESYTLPDGYATFIYLRFLSSGISTFRKFEELEADALKDGALSRKYKELIALGISITQKCYG